MRKLPAILTMLCMLSTAAFSEETPKQNTANAQLFLQAVAKQHGMKFAIFDKNVNNYGNYVDWSGYHWDTREPQSGTHAYPTVTVRDIGPAGCLTAVYGEPWSYETTSKVQSEIAGPRMNNNRTRTFGVSFSPPTTSLIIDWAKVSGTEIDHTTVKVINVAKFWLPTEDLAKRVHYAMEFLRNGCDVTAETGF